MIHTIKAQIRTQYNQALQKDQKIVILHNLTQIVKNHNLLVWFLNLVHFVQLASASHDVKLKPIVQSEPNSESSQLRLSESTEDINLDTCEQKPTLSVDPNNNSHHEDTNQNSLQSRPTCTSIQSSPTEVPTDCDRPESPKVDKKLKPIVQNEILKVVS